MSLRHEWVTVGDRRIHVVEAGAADGEPFLFLHGWPESWRAWEGVMRVAGREARLIAIDLPGIGESSGGVPGGSKVGIAEVVHGLVEELGLRGLTLVGHDVGGMVTYAYLRKYEVGRVVIMNTAIPGVEPWDRVMADPRTWHFGLHGESSLPEELVRGREGLYFDHFFDVLSGEAGVSGETRAAHAEAYRSETALSAGFDLYRGFEQDARDNAGFAEGPAVETPVLYMHEGGGVSVYEDGLRKAGVRDLRIVALEGVGHFAPEEAPEEVWKAIRA